MYKWGIVRIDSVIICHLSERCQFLNTVWCISGEAAGEIWNWSLLGVKEGLGFFRSENPDYVSHCSIHKILLENGFLLVEIRKRIVCSTVKSEIPILKLKPGVPNRKHPNYTIVGSYIVSTYLGVIWSQNSRRLVHPWYSTHASRCCIVRNVDRYRCKSRLPQRPVCIASRSSTGTGD